MDTNETHILTGGTWYCPHECDDPSHGRHGNARIYYKGRYYKPGQLITDL